MKRINLLSEETSNKIAAGEVVERPASVVKELVENSIDANSQNITIEIKESGKEEIKITDDGIGIHPEDVKKAFMPHGTSKISFIEDLYSINTFGFRGEALPSIAAVSNVLLKTKTKDSNFGKEISVSGGKVNYVKDTGCNIGTVIEVKDLFFNVPAREKFLKSDKRESGLISNIINRLALANHNISFKYYNNDKRSLITFASEDVKNTIRAIYGKNIYENIISFEKHSDIVSVYGYVGNSEISRGSRNNQSIFVNKRYIKSGIITTAVENAFKSFSTVNKFPFFVLFLDIYPEFLDVNVHPTKSEVKFQDERIIYKVVFDAVHSALSDSVRKSFSLEFEEEDSEPTPVQIPIDLKDKEIKPVINNLECLMSNLNTVKFNNDSNNINNQLINKDNSTNINEKEYNKYDKEDTFLKENTNISRDTTYKIDTNYKTNNNNACKEQSDTLEQIAKFPKLNVIGQFNKTYILAQTLDIFYMIDQHAAHEKILFEKFRNQIKNRDVISQILLTPVVIEMSAEDFAYYLDNKNIFQESGFSVELFGDNTISIREAPMLLGKVSTKDFFLEILDDIKNMGKGNIEEVKHNMIASLACKAAIKANHSLSYEEMCSLIDELRYIEEPFNCPHGRPTIIKSSLKEIEKKFKRIQ
ncbi:DNA mismatch repair endonuclease MutL [Clostridium botulinum]|uniref:DNA mismatch repair endonuclease MutL n=2 Tax=Clostridium botulinum TaxID=1491 RepID=UPI0004D664D0|nr:DNA mismatch repair endonuclease MutL [Clostridium botulinum]KEI04435.1 DNA mismatch repair protein MutL [Clostridium botulinum C/D str. BKT75002]KEI11344.1 DNA mismatch repair protein MutL [Clostridium botulinum C/D str. BKT2873]KGM95536.1 DNA mismatch repair protein MutL [Clostridium botulinum D str. CCUG 7971]KOC47782.1 DNA mismatch repair protein MutL [Clostridium botulinum]KOC51221.1 DNA mismatch repair protein MutL [Clostridium botulinum]